MMGRCLALFIALPLLMPAVALAECPKWPDDIRAIARSSAVVFSGTVKKIESITGAKWRGAEAVTFEVEKVWKGSPTKRFVIYNVTVTNIADLGFPLQRGSTYIVFANRQTVEERAAFGLAASAPTTFGLGSCGGGTRMYEEATTEIAKLGPARASSPK